VNPYLLLDLNHLVEESPSNGRGVSIRSDDGSRQLVGFLPVVASDLKELIEDPVMQRDLPTTKLLKEVAGSDCVSTQAVVGMTFLKMVIPPDTPLLQGDIRSQGSGTPSAPHNLKGNVNTINKLR